MIETQESIIATNQGSQKTKSNDGINLFMNRERYLVLSITFIIIVIGELGPVTSGALKLNVTALHLESPYVRIPHVTR